MGTGTRQGSPTCNSVCCLRAPWDTEGGTLWIPVMWLEHLWEGHSPLTHCIPSRIRNRFPEADQLLCWISLCWMRVKCRTDALEAGAVQHEGLGLGSRENWRNCPAHVRKENCVSAPLSMYASTTLWSAQTWFCAVLYSSPRPSSLVDLPLPLTLYHRHTHAHILCGVQEDAFPIHPSFCKRAVPPFSFLMFWSSFLTFLVVSSISPSL